MENVCGFLVSYSYILSEEDCLVSTAGHGFMTSLMEGNLGGVCRAVGKKTGSRLRFGSSAHNFLSLV